MTNKLVLLSSAAKAIKISLFGGKKPSRQKAWPRNIHFSATSSECGQVPGGPDQEEQFALGTIFVLITATWFSLSGRTSRARAPGTLP